MKAYLKALNHGLDPARLAGPGGEEFKQILSELLKLKIISKYKKNYHLNDGFVFGTVDLTSRGLGFLECLDESFKKDLLIENEHLNGAAFKDLVCAKIVKPTRRRAASQGGRPGPDRPRVRVILILKRHLAHSLVLTQRQGERIIGVDLKNELLIPLKIPQKTLAKFPLGSVLKIDNATGRLASVLGHISDEGIDEQLSLALFDKAGDFSAQLEAQAAKDAAKVMKNALPSRSGRATKAGAKKPEPAELARLDLRNLPFCTIDPITAKDYDDALYFDEGQRELYVAIADVSAFVRPGGAVDAEAAARGFSIYFPHRAIPMLPRVLSEDYCSLVPGADRLVFGFRFSFTAKNELASAQIFSGVINSKRRFNYDEVDEFLFTHSPQAYPPDFSPPSKGKKPRLPAKFAWLYGLFDLTQILRERRLARAYAFTSNELKMSLDEAGALSQTHYESETPSHGLIEECMLLANKAAASLLTGEALTGKKPAKKSASKSFAKVSGAHLGIFRNHPPSEPRKIAKLLEDLIPLGIKVKFQPSLPTLVRQIQAQAEARGRRGEVDTLSIKTQQRAEYEAINKGHFGLGFSSYTHFTSPIRRYSDLLLHRFLKEKISPGKKSAKKPGTLINAELCEELSTLEREADKVAWDFLDRKFARWAARHIGESFRAVLIKKEGSFLARLDDEVRGAVLFLRSSKRVKMSELALLERLQVEIIEVDLARAKIYARVKNPAASPAASSAAQTQNSPAKKKRKRKRAKRPGQAPAAAVNSAPAIVPASTLPAPPAAAAKSAKKSPAKKSTPPPTTPAKSAQPAPAALSAPKKSPAKSAKKSGHSGQSTGITPTQPSPASPAAAKQSSTKATPKNSTPPALSAPFDLPEAVPAATPAAAKLKKGGGVRGRDCLPPHPPASAPATPAPTTPAPAAKSAKKSPAKATAKSRKSKPDV